MEDRREREREREEREEFLKTIHRIFTKKNRNFFRREREREILFYVCDERRTYLKKRERGVSEDYS